MKTKYKHLTFYENPDGKVVGKTGYTCINKSGELLGYIEWFLRWEQYCYFDESRGVYSQSCLLDIADFLNQLK